MSQAEAPGAERDLKHLVPSKKAGAVLEEELTLGSLQGSQI